MGSLFGNKAPTPPPVVTPPPAPPKVPTPDEAANSEEAQRAKAIALKSVGREQTIATSQQGATDNPEIKIKKLTGQ